MSFFTDLHIGGKEKTHVLNPDRDIKQCSAGHLHLITVGDLVGDSKGNPLDGRAINIMFKAGAVDLGQNKALKDALEKIPGVKYLADRSIAEAEYAPSLLKGPVFQLTNGYSIPVNAKDHVSNALKEAIKLRASEAGQIFLVVNALIEEGLLPVDNKEVALEQLGVTKEHANAFEKIVNPSKKREL